MSLNLRSFNNNIEEHIRDINVLQPKHTFKILVDWILEENGSTSRVLPSRESLVNKC